MSADVVHIQPAEVPRTEELRTEQPDTPAIGKWYWVKPDADDADQRPQLACVTHLGSNYVELSFVDEDGRTRRYHDAIFWQHCEFVADADALLRGNAERCRRELDGLMEEVKLLTSKLGVAPSQALGSGEAAATQLVLATSAPVAEYKTALVKAKEETLPALFEQIKGKSAEYSRWLTAQVIPMQAEADKLKPAIKRVEDRIFSVELYAGLCEEVEQIRDGEPAALTEPVHLFQRRLYMDEECLANYDTGGMEFKDLRAFERWLCRKVNFERVFPFPRTVVSFQVRHHDKKRDIAGFRDFVKMMNEKDLDKLTFLYIRNGSRVYRLSTEINFGEKLFPDLDHPVLSAGEGQLYADLSGFRDEYKIIGEAEYLAMVNAEEAEIVEYQRRVAEEEKKPKKKREYIHSPGYRQSNRYEPFTKESVHYDDISKYIRGEMEKHNRIVLVLQGLLDRSPALHPHPPWKLFEADGFGQALALHRDVDRVFAAGDKPDFEAFRAQCNASLVAGSVTVGQEDAWLRFEARKENARRDADYRWRRTEYRPETFQPAGDPGPGRFARVARLDRQGHAHYRWTKERARLEGPPVSRKYGCKTARVLNVDAYQPGDYKRFFSDPRTREDYLQWAPLLLAAEEYKAGRHGEVAPLAEPPNPAKKPKPTGEASHLRMLRGFLGKAVRLVEPLSTKGGSKYGKGSLWRVTGLSKGEFTIVGIDKQGEIEFEVERDEAGEVTTRRQKRGVRCVSHRDFVVEPSVATDPAYEFKVAKRERVGHVDDEED